MDREFLQGDEPRDASGVLCVRQHELITCVGAGDLSYVGAESLPPPFVVGLSFFLVSEEMKEECTSERREPQQLRHGSPRVCRGVRRGGDRSKVVSSSSTSHTYTTTQPRGWRGCVVCSYVAGISSSVFTIAVKRGSRASRFAEMIRSSENTIPDRGCPVW